MACHFWSFHSGALVLTSATNWVKGVLYFWTVLGSLAEDVVVLSSTAAAAGRLRGGIDQATDLGGLAEEQLDMHGEGMNVVCFEKGAFCVKFREFVRPGLFKFHEFLTKRGKRSVRAPLGSEARSAGASVARACDFFLHAGGSSSRTLRTLGS